MQLRGLVSSTNPGRDVIFDESLDLCLAVFRPFQAWIQWQKWV